MSTGSDIIRTVPPKPMIRGKTMKNSAAQGLDFHMAAAGMFVTQQHSNSNVKIFARKMHKSQSDDHLFNVAMTRTRSLEDLNGLDNDGAISVSYSLNDTTTYPFDISEHLLSAWDNYQVILMLDFLSSLVEGFQINLVAILNYFSEYSRYCILFRFRFPSILSQKLLIRLNRRCGYPKIFSGKTFISMKTMLLILSDITNRKE